MRRGAKGGLFVPVDELGDAAAQIEQIGSSEDVWVGVLPRHVNRQSGEIGGSREFITQAKALWVDCDLKESPDARQRLANFRPPPHLIVASGGGFHAYWLIEQPLDADWVPIANRRLAYALGADLAATDATRILRPPGTRNLKYQPPRPVELVELRHSPALPVRELVGNLPNPPGKRAVPRRLTATGFDLAADPLRAIPPPVYVRELSGTEVPDTGGMVSCPLPDHDDPEPSCQVFAQPERGWYCYGCQRGGSIYDFAAPLLGRQTSGRDFLALRRELERRFAVTRPAEQPGRHTTAPGRGPVGASAPAAKHRPGATALIEPPTQFAAPAGPTVNHAAALVGPDGEGERGVAAADPEPETSGEDNSSPTKHGLVLLPAGLPTVKALVVVCGALAIGMGLFVVVFSIIPLSRPESGELVVCGVSAQGRGEIPARYLILYRAAGRRFGLDWAVLAAIGFTESGHGANMGPSSAGALGPMQFMPATWAAYGVDANNDGRRDIMDPEDAIPGAANYLRASGAPADWWRALFAYNHADWYVQQVLDQAERYRAACREIAESFSPGNGSLDWPVRGPVTSPFGMRWGRLHAGIDIAAPAGTPVHAAKRGRVALRAPVSGYGNYLCIQHLPQLSTCYAHLSGYRARLDQIVQRGQVVGLVGCTGHCFGYHLHFEVRLGPPFSRPVDPMRYLGRNQ
jgi:hypothetical protein